MRLTINVKKAIFFMVLSASACPVLLASTVINNYGTANQPPQAMQQPMQQPPQQQCNANSVSTDPRVPPAGTYNIPHADGSSEEVYTTGEKKPYYVDNNCNQNANQVVPQVYVQPNTVGPMNGPATR